MLPTLSALLLPLLVPAAPQDGVSRTHDFEQEDAASEFVAFADGDFLKRRQGPFLQDGKLCLLESWWKSSSSVAFAAPTDALHEELEVAFTLIMNTGTEGAGFAWLPVADHGSEGAAPELEAWETPTLPGTFAVGFDASNPPSRDPFRGSGNPDDRPQHEVSLHWDDFEIVKMTTPKDFRDEEPHAVTVSVRYVCGGAEVTLTIDEDVLFERYFIPSMTAYVGRPAFGGHNGDNAGDVLIDDLSYTCRGPLEAPAAPLRVVGLERVLNDHAHGTNEAEVAFPEDTDAYGRIICTLRLDKPETRFDPWDRTAHVFLWDDEGQQIEVLRYITPYHKGHVWQVDVSDFRPILRGTRRLQQHCGTQGEGWVVSVYFDFYPGPAERYAESVIPLWSGGPEVGNPDEPTTDFYVPRSIEVPEGLAAARVRTVVTGHGMSPNSNNAAEFMPLGRTLTVNGESFYDVLWKTDNYLNPCRPQGGTWKYDRAGWAPGDVVRPWAVEVGHLIGPERKLDVAYVLDEYVNENRGQTWAPSHRTEGQLILYRVP